MRRPPDKDGHPTLSERDVDSSNATLNTLFGGARQKSWMTGPGAPVRPTPRASISRASMPQATSAQEAMTAVLPSPAPSDGPSPVLMNPPVTAPRNENRREIHDDEIRRPSTIPITNSTPIPQPTSSEADIETPRVLHTNNVQCRSSSSSAWPNNQPQLQSVNQAQGIHSQPPLTITDIPPLPSSVLLPSDRRQLSQEVQSPTIQEPTLVQHQLQGSPQRPSQSRLAQVSPPIGQQPAGMQTQPQVTNDTQRVQRERNQFPSPSHASASPPRFPSDLRPNPTMTQNDPRSHPSLSVFPSKPSKRQRTQVAVMPSLKNRIVLIEKHIESAGGHLNLNTGLERPRFQLLVDACNNEDSFYVALHQVFVVWDFNRQEIASIRGFPNQNVLMIAFKILGELIRDNEQLAPNHKSWFAKFPSPLSDLLNTSETYRNTVASIGIFLGRLATEWTPLSQECTSRGFPPLVDELVNRMALLSPILQGVVFTATRRNLGIRDEEIGSRMEDLFKRDQRDHQALAARYNTARPPTAREVHERNSTLAHEYLMLHNHLIQQRRSAAAAIAGNISTHRPPSMVPSNAEVQSGGPNPSHISGTQQGVGQTSWHQSMPSHDPNRNWQVANQQLQGMSRTATASPNPSNIAGRPASVGAHRNYTNTPSPTLLQGLSVQSPAQQGFQFPSMVRNNNTQLQSSPNGQSYAAANSVATFHQNPVTNADLALQQRAHISLQAQQQASQAQSQWPQSPLQQQVFMQQQQQHQQQQIQQAVGQQVSNLNRAAQLRRDSSNVIDSQRTHSRNNSMNSNGHRTPIVNPLTGPPPRPVVPPRPPTSDQIQSDIQAYILKHPLTRPFIPPLGFVHPSRPTNPDLTALHQAHIRSPRLVAVDGPPPGTVQDNSTLRYYQVIRGFALPPTKISMSGPISKFEFRIPEAELALMPRDISAGNGQVLIREFRRGTLQYRLRCIQTKRTDTKCSTPDWVIKDTVWPESATLAINENQLELRRKNHHGKDLPIDITPFLRRSVPNANHQVRMTIIRGRTKMKEFNYFIAVEVVEILQHGQIIEICQQNRIPASKTLDNIKRSLAGPSDDDDDIAMVVSDLSIDLADPFTARIFETPVRGSNCLHRECFDLETFLLTRNSKPKRPEQPCMIDVWKCPLCGKDARPYCLQIDGFLILVRQTLEAQGNLDVKAIWIAADGSWRPKVEKRKAMADPNDSEDSSDEENTRKQNNFAAENQPNQARNRRVVEVIDLADD